MDQSVGRSPRSEAWGSSLHASGCVSFTLWSCLLLFAGCTPDSGQNGTAADVAPGTNRPPIIHRATIKPTPLVLSEPLSVDIEAEDPDLNPLTFRYQWFVNGNPVPGEAHPTLSPSFLKRDDLVSAEIVAFDGQVASNAFKTVQVAVGNTPPQVTKLALESLEPDHKRLRIVVEGIDADHDSIRYTFRWRRNGTMMFEGEDQTFDPGSLAREDTITVEAIPRDGYGSGASKISDAVQAGNTAPKITSQPPTRFEKGVFSYGVQAVDDDKDTLKYRLVSAPAGMTIDPSTGVITWPIGSDVKGKHRVRLAVEDGQGGSAFQEFEVTFPSPGTPS